LTSQGIVFLHAGTEFRRTKRGVENSYESPDSINAIDWTNKSTHFDFYQYVRSLVQLRKMHPAFRFTDKAALLRSVRFDDRDTSGVVSFRIDGQLAKDPWKRIWVRYTGLTVAANWQLEPGWKPAILNNRAVYSKEEVRKISVRPATLNVLYQ
jgi:pullulanase